MNGALLLLAVAVTGEVGPPVDVGDDLLASSAFSAIAEDASAAIRERLAAFYAGTRVRRGGVAMAVEVAAGVESDDASHPLIGPDAVAYVHALVDAGRTSEAANAADYLRARGVRLDLPLSGPPEPPAGVDTIDLTQAGPIATISNAARTELWQFGIGGVPVAAPVFSGGSVYLRQADRVDAFSLSDGQLRWTKRFRDEGVPIAELVERTVTETVFSSPREIGGRLYFVTETGRSLQLTCVDAADGSTIWTGIENAVAPPLLAGGSLWIPCFDGEELTVAYVRPDGMPGEVQTLSVGLVPMKDGDRWRTRQAAALGLAGGRVVVAFNEGALASIDPYLKRVDWAATVPVHAPPPGAAAGRAAIVPRSAFPRPAVATSGSRAIAICPDWVDAMTCDAVSGHLRAVDGVDHPRSVGVAGGQLWAADRGRVVAVATGEVATSPSAMLPTTGRLPAWPLWDGGVFHRDGRTHGRWWPTDPQTTVIPALAEYRGEVWSSRGGRLSKLRWDDREPTADQRHAIAAGVSLASSLVGGPASWIHRVVAGVPPQIAVEGRLTSLVDGNLRPPIRVSGEEPPTTPTEWPPLTPGEPAEQPRFLTSESWAVVPIVPGDHPQPPDLSIELETQRQMTLRVRAGGRTLPIVRLPGRDGDDRKSASLYRAWHDGRSVVVRLGLEVFGLRMTGPPGDPGCEVAWPLMDGYPLGPGRTAIVQTGLADEVRSPVGPLLVDRLGRFAGDIVVGETVVLRRRGMLVGLDRATGWELWRRNDPPEGPLIGQVNGETIALDVGGFRRFSRDGRETFSPQDSPPREDPVTPDDAVVALAADADWVFELNERSRGLRLRRPGVTHDVATLGRTDRVVAAGDGVVVWDDDSRRLFYLAAPDRPADLSESRWSMPVPFDEEVRDLIAVNVREGHLIGVGTVVSEPSLLNANQRGGLLRKPAFEGLLARFNADGTIRWTRRSGPMAVALDQPQDVPVLVFEWLQPRRTAGGGISAVPATHVLVLDDRTGEVLVEMNSRSPRGLRFRPDPERERLVFDLGTLRQVVRFGPS